MDTKQLAEVGSTKVAHAVVAEPRLHAELEPRLVAEFSFSFFVTAEGLCIRQWHVKIVVHDVCKVHVACTEQTFCLHEFSSFVPCLSVVARVEPQ